MSYRLKFPSEHLPLFSTDSSTLPLCILLILFLTSHALPPKPVPPPNSGNLSVNLPPWAQGRLFAISDTAPLANNLQRDANYIEAISLLTGFLASIEEQVDIARQNTSSIDYGRSCNVRPATWPGATYHVAMNRGWPATEVNESTCTTDYYGVPPSFPHSVEQMREIVGRGFASLERKAYRIMLDTVGNWTNAEVDVSLPFEFPSQTCNLNNYGVFRLHGKWWTSISLTSRPSHLHLPDGQRVTISEVHRIANGTIVPALMTLPINPGIGEEHSVTDRATTIQTTWGGSVNPFSRFEPSTAHENVGLKAALAKGDNFAQQIEDVILASNTAILAFPLVLNLVPVSLVTRCDKWKLLTYVLLSDVLTVLPMLIKGIELWSIGNARFTEVVTRIGDTFAEETIAAEMWIASCRVNHNARTIGIIFMTASSLALVVGIVLEVIAKSLTSRVRRQQQQEMEEMQYLREYEQIGWKYYSQVRKSHGWITEDDESPLAVRRVHDVWTPISEWNPP
eukprot:TRINITY_DN78410_c0_g1_i1.p1 TRINITY_DN78410_c0_g1~~TRINITY_DN78410_c0_g1_i1.p1  ORF type:complete len:509 (-),score=47.18 TRINITY_DN78410_c0_g1_i1:330-1856(-)